eukprot:m.54710 g.54710  ORF g.54710 m.54710 type:complete len:83 (-) comp11441_c0_seq3:425-673(-)
MCEMKRVSGRWAKWSVLAQPTTSLSTTFVQAIVLCTLANRLQNRRLLLAVSSPVIARGEDLSENVRMPSITRGGVSDNVTLL